ncbi:MAG TPA: hypothetical protein VNF99_08040 [Stellaceae bacterium]|nr:hypothetical protein [Stellaceae bacterium]
MKKILIAAALAGAIVGAFASLSVAAPMPGRLAGSGSPRIVDMAAGPASIIIS